MTGWHGRRGAGSITAMAVGLVVGAAAFYPFFQGIGGYPYRPYRPSGSGGSGGSAPPPPPKIWSILSNLNHPQGLCFESASRVYVADTDGNRVLALDPNHGTYTVVAGDGTPGFGGDGGPATNAQLHHPTDVVLDGAGNLYVSDTDNHRIRRVDAAGTITTVCGDGSAGSSGDGGPATSAQLHHPTGLALDVATDILYVADARNNRVRSVSGGVIDAVAGDGTPGFSGDGGSARGAQLRLSAAYFRMGALAVDAAGDLWIADSGNHCIRKVSGGIITREVGTGSFGLQGDGSDAQDADLAYPAGLAFYPNGDLLVADAANSRLRRVRQSDWTLWHVAGDGLPGFGGDGGEAELASLYAPMGLAIDPANDDVYLADVENDRIRRIR